ncbi:MAG: nicotinate-nucleotide adenylyltransferase [Acidobacteria bacterium]|nr:nicotinate-nucleotide adenylyltransferase [Acidobacteriota bacterium]MCA1638625.1 nicotinate-nucleotide adenylyltransferase [Acidobacteriota bacterium]
MSATTTKIAFYGGSFDPFHNGHLEIANKLTGLFELDEFVFIPAFHAPHKKDKKPTSAFHRFAMLSLATNDESKIRVSKMELDAPEKPYTFETLTKLKNELTDAEIFFVMGADSWEEITTWREWETVLTLTNVVVVTRPGFEIGFSHVTEAIRARIVDLRESNQQSATSSQRRNDSRIYITNAVQIDVSSTEIRRKIREKQDDWCEDVPQAVAKHIEKYELYI